MRPLPVLSLDAQSGATPQLAWWRIGRAILWYILDTIALARSDGADILTPLITWCVVEANVVPVYNDPAQARRYATLAAALPDELRRPISINAVAASLHLPFETIRRRVAALTAQGRCVATPKGVYVPYAALSGAAYDALALARYERLQAFYAELEALGALRGLELCPPGAPGHDAPPVRAANRAVLAYMLRLVDDIIRRWGEPIPGLLFLAMTRANAEHTPPEALTVDAPLSDALRTPITALALARRAGLSRETVRRHLARLEADGYCRRSGSGWLAALERLDEGRGARESLAEMLAAVHFLMARCAALGVTSYWGGPPGESAAKDNVPVK